MDGALMELGPYRVKEDGKLVYNEGSWDEFANLLFVDNPVGTGFSYVDTDSYIHELQEMADQFMIFLEKWFALFPEYEHDDLYIAGESYAGQHIPYIARSIINRNKDKSAVQHHWNLKGLLMGNAWISPLDHYQTYLSFAYAENIIAGGSEEARKVEAKQSSCMADLSQPGGMDRVDTTRCEAVLQTILDVTRDGKKCINMYDIRLKEDETCGASWPPDLATVTPYLRRDDVKAALHVNPDKRTGWTECSGAVSSNFRARNSKPSIQLLPGLLEAGIPIVLFSGAKDLICNHFGTEQFISNMNWSGGTGFEISPGVWAPKRDWTFEGEAAGIYQEARNLTYVLFYNASHMVPFDWPRRTRDMLDRFIGVDIASIGGIPADSRIDGEKAGSETSVGGHPNSTLAQAEEKKKLSEAEWRAYYKSGEAVLVVVIIAASLWGWLVWRGRRKERRRGYVSVPLGNGHGPFEAFRSKRGAEDVEAGDFDENELDDLKSRRIANGSAGQLDNEQYSLGSDSDGEADDGRSRKLQDTVTGLERG
jgi:carboxypeptidase D